MVSEIEFTELAGEAEDAVEAIGAIRRLKPNVAILDIRITGGGGIRVLEEVMKFRSAPVVIMLTAFPYPQYKAKCLEIGAEYFFDKSTEFEKVAGVLRNLI